MDNNHQKYGKTAIITVDHGGEARVHLGLFVVCLFVCPYADYDPDPDSRICLSILHHSEIRPTMTAKYVLT